MSPAWGWALVKKNVYTWSWPRASRLRKEWLTLYHFDSSRPPFLSPNYTAKVVIHTKAKIPTTTTNCPAHPVLAASKACFCFWKGTVATVQLEELFQGAGNTLAVNELFFARMSDSSCAPVNSLLLPWETKPSSSEELKEVSQGSPCGSSPLRSQRHRHLTYKSPQPWIHYSSSFSLLGPWPVPGKGPGRPRVPLPHPLNCSLGRFPHLQHHNVWNWASLHVSLTETVFLSLLALSSSCQMTMCPFFPFSSLRLTPAQNNPLWVLKCLLGTVFSEHKYLGRTLLDQVSGKSVAQAGDNSSMDKNMGLGEGKG